MADNFETDLHIPLRAEARSGWSKVAEWEQVHPDELARVWLSQAAVIRPVAFPTAVGRADADRLSRDASGRWRGRRHAERQAADIVMERTAGWALEVVDWLVAVNADVEDRADYWRRQADRERRRARDADRELQRVLDRIAALAETTGADE